MSAPQRWPWDLLPDCFGQLPGGARWTADLDTRIFQQALSTATAVVFIRGRVKFGVLRPSRRQAAASHPSALLGWNVDLTPRARLAGGAA